MSMAVTTVSDTVRLRPVTNTDQPFLAALYATTRDDLALLPLAGDQRDALVAMQYRAQDLHYRQQFPGAAFDVVESGGRPVGRLYVDRGADDIRVVDISLLPEHRGGGIGAALVRALQDEASTTGRTLSLHVAIDNRAAVLYERLGFRLVEDLGMYRRLEWTAP
jgi:ribosomal protein S18 acetylase RimI-like enzyme